MNWIEENFKIGWSPMYEFIGADRRGKSKYRLKGLGKRIPNKQELIIIKIKQA